MAARNQTEYREYPAPFFLRSHLMCLWTQSVEHSTTPYAHRVLPDACIDIVFINDEFPVVVGPYVESFIATLPPGTKIIGARFHPGRASGFLGHPASALLNQSVPVDALWNKAACSDFVSPVWEASGIANRLSALETALMSRLPRTGSPDPAVMAGIKWLADHPEARVEHLSGWIGICSRQLQRRFSIAVGFSPKMFQQVLRFQYLLNRAKYVADRPPLADLAAAAGYADQAHMSREVRRFSDVPPMELLGRALCTLGLSGLIRSSAP
jgi:AraC-like DNA-binding protein